jgi:hypothetical protein
MGKALTSPIRKECSKWAVLTRVLSLAAVSQQTARPHWTLAHYVAAASAQIRRRRTGPHTGGTVLAMSRPCSQAYGARPQLAACWHVGRPAAMPGPSPSPTLGPCAGCERRRPRRRDAACPPRREPAFVEMAVRPMWVGMRVCVHRQSAERVGPPARAVSPPH